MKLNFLTKRRDACWQVRVLIPMSHLISRGHSCEEDEFEKIIICPKCAGKFILEYGECNDDVICADDKELLISHKEIIEWEKNVDRLIEEADVITFQRPIEIAHLNLMKRAKKMGKVVCQTADDHYLDVPSFNTGYNHYVQRKAIIEESFKTCDGVDVTTKGLKSVYLKYCNFISVIPNSQDIEIIDATPELPYVTGFDRYGKQIEDYERFRAGRKVFLWGGSPTHEKDLEIIVSSFRRISRSENALFVFVGYCHRAIVEQAPRDGLMIVGGVPHSIYFMLYKALKADFSLAPVCDVPFNVLGKSSNKAVEAEVLRQLPIMSNLETYRGCSPMGIYSENDDKSWYEAMKQACRMEKSEYDERIVANRKFAEDHFDIKNNVLLWEEHFSKLLEAKK